MATDQEIQKFVDDAIKAAPPDPADLCCGQVGKAFRDLQARRQVPGASLDENLAAAEHYMFARWMVCTGTVGFAQMSALVVGYDVQKLLDKWKGDANKQQVTANPVSPPSAMVVKWGLSGAAKGRQDHGRCNASVIAPWWRSLEEIFGPGRSITVAGKKY